MAQTMKILVDCLATTIPSQNESPAMRIQTRRCHLHHHLRRGQQGLKLLQHCQQLTGRLMQQTKKKNKAIAADNGIKEEEVKSQQQE